MVIRRQDIEEKLSEADEAMIRKIEAIIDHRISAYYEGTELIIQVAAEEYPRKEWVQKRIVEMYQAAGWKVEFGWERVGLLWFSL